MNELMDLNDIKLRQSYQNLINANFYVQQKFKRERGKKKKDKCLFMPTEYGHRIKQSTYFATSRLSKEQLQKAESCHVHEIE